MALFLMVASFIIFIMLGMPIAFVIGLSSFIYLLAAGVNIFVIPQTMMAFQTQFVLLAVPLFTFAAQLMVETSMTQRIVRIVNSFLGFIKGGLALVNIGASMIFAGISGAAIADASSIGTIMYRAMVKEGYDSAYTAAVSAASASVGPIIPPSIPMIVAGSMVNVSVSKLFIGGIIPGLMMSLGMGIVAIIIAYMYNHPSKPLPNSKEIINAFKEGFFDIMMPIVVIGGIVTGIATPTEASALAAAYVLVIGLLRREISPKNFKNSCISTISTTAEVLFIASMAMVLGWVLTYEKIPYAMVEFIAQSNLSLFWLKFWIVTIVLILGTFLSGMESLLIALPLFIPVAESLGLDIFHVTLVIVLAANLGTITPPVGLTLYIMSSVSKESIWRISWKMLPFLGVNIAIAFLVMYFPKVATYLPNLFK